jgi:hypothetical protein
MSIVVEARIPAGSLLSEEATRLPAGTSIEFDSVVPVREIPLPYLRIRGDDPGAAADVVRGCRHVADLELVDGNDDQQLYAVHWNEVPPFVRCIREAEGALLRALATAESWLVECRFPTEAAVSRFESACTDLDVDLSVTRIGRRGLGLRESNVTEEQRHSLARALEAGYFEVPRETTLVELAEEFGVSDSAMSQRLRRGIRSVLEECDELDDLN